MAAVERTLHSGPLWVKAFLDDNSVRQESECRVTIWLTALSAVTGTVTLRLSGKGFLNPNWLRIGSKTSSKFEVIPTLERDLARECSFEPEDGVIAFTVSMRVPKGAPASYRGVAASVKYSLAITVSTEENETSAKLPVLVRPPLPLKEPATREEVSELALTPISVPMNGVSEPPEMDIRSGEPEPEDDTVAERDMMSPIFGRENEEQSEGGGGEAEASKLHPVALVARIGKWRVATVRPRPPSCECSPGESVRIDVELDPESPVLCEKVSAFLVAREEVAKGWARNASERAGESVVSEGHELMAGGGECSILLPVPEGCTPSFSGDVCSLTWHLSLCLNCQDGHGRLQSARLAYPLLLR